MKENNRQKSRQPLSLYIREISSIPLLSREEEIELARKIQEGNQQALQKLVESNLRFVVKVAKRYAGFGYSLQDLINEGNLGLIEAAKRFDPQRGVKFISYAIWWIRQSMLSALSNFVHPLRIPTRVNLSLLKIRESMSQNENAETDTRITLDEIATNLGITEKELISTLRAGGTRLSLEQPLYSGSQISVGDTIEQSSIRSADCDLLDHSFRKSLEGILNGLKEKEQQVLRMRFGLDRDSGLTLREIGDELGVSRERIRQIEAKALTRLRSNPKVREMRSALSDNLEAL